jgi:DNA-binding protein YbaB
VGYAIVGKRLADVDKKALEALIVAAVKGRKAKAKDATKKASERAKGES